MTRQLPRIMRCSAQLSGSHAGDGFPHSKLKFNGLLLFHLKETSEKGVFVGECWVANSKVAKRVGTVFLQLFVCVYGQK